MKRSRVLWLCVAALAMTSTVMAQGVEIQPFVGYRFGGSIGIDDAQATGFDIQPSGSFGLSVGWFLNPTQQLGFRWTHQSTGLDVDGQVPGHGSTLSGFDVDSLQFEGSYIPGFDEDPVRPFVVFGAGATRFGAPNGFSGSRTQIGISIGGGARVPLGKKLGLCFQGRWTPTFYGSNTSLFCSSGGGCYATASGDFASQFEVSAGLLIRL